MALYPQQDWTMESLKRKFQEMARAKMITGNLNMLPHICGAKRVYYTIVKKTDGSTGDGSDDSFFKTRDNNSHLDEEEMEDGEEWGEVGVKEVISRAAGGRMMPGTPLVMVDAGQALG